MLHKATLVKHLVLARGSVTDLVRMSIWARIKEREEIGRVAVYLIKRTVSSLTITLLSSPVRSLSTRKTLTI